MSETSAAAVRRRPSPTPARARLRDIWHHVGFRAWAYQFLVVATIIGAGFYLIGNAQDALSKRGISTGFDFLFDVAGFDIGEKSIAYQSADTFLRAYGVAVLNTLKVSAVGIVLTTLIGVTIGIARLSSNYLIRTFASAYVEIFRNTPQLVQLIFWYTVITHLPQPRQAISLFGSVFLSNRGIALPWLSDSTAFGWMLLAFACACAASFLLFRWTDAGRMRAGRPRLARWWAIVPIVGAPALVWLFAGAPSGLSVPRMQGFNFQGGITISPEFLSLLLGLSLYVAAFIAEIVRAGIQSVGKGQIEAVRTIGLKHFDAYRKVILPQALRVMVPPAAGQYVSLVKNSSLGVAIGYPELFSVNNTIITLSGHTVEAIAIMMAIYLSISFAIAALMNLYNRFVQIKER